MFHCAEMSPGVASCNIVRR